MLNELSDGMAAVDSWAYMDLDDYLSSSDVKGMMELVINDVLGRHAQMVESICQDPAWSYEDVVSDLRLEFLRVMPLVRDAPDVRNKRGYRYRFYYTCLLNQLRRLYNASKRRNVRDGGSLEALREVYGDLFPELGMVDVESIADEVVVLRVLIGGLLGRLKSAERILVQHGLLSEYHALLSVCCEGGSCESCSGVVVEEV